MPRCHWDHLPEDVRSAAELHTGPVLQVSPVAAGSVSEVAATLHTAQGKMFCKGIRTDSPQAWAHRNEARLNPWLPDVAPRLLWTVEEAGWLLLGFEHAPGRYPNLSPGSPDLEAVADVLAALGEALTPCPAPARSFAQRWAGRIAPELVDGDTLLHTDVSPKNFLLLGDRMRVVDWAAPARGAAWIDTAFMVLRLIRAGHSPHEAEEWAQTLPAWRTAPRVAVTAFACTVADLWEEKARTSPAPHRGPLASSARAWATYRVPRRMTVA